MVFFRRSPFSFPRADAIRDAPHARPLSSDRSDRELEADRLRAACDAETDLDRRARLLEALRRRLHALLRAEGPPAARRP